MHPLLQAGLALLCVVLGAILREILPGSRFVARLAGKPTGHNILGTWESTWGEPPDGPFDRKENLVVSTQRREHVAGYVTREDQPRRKWEIDGRYDGHFLQLNYYPARDATDTDFFDYGCYFLTRHTDGTFSGYSTGFGPYDEKPGEGLSIKIHRLQRI
jgi:hypothetical protein